jgi:hypothetical protein
LVGLLRKLINATRCTHVYVLRIYRKNRVTLHHHCSRVTHSSVLCICEYAHLDSPMLETSHTRGGGPPCGVCITPNTHASWTSWSWVWPHRRASSARARSNRGVKRTWRRSSVVACRANVMRFHPSGPASRLRSVVVSFFLAKYIRTFDGTCLSGDVHVYLVTYNMLRLTLAVIVCS